MSEIKVNNNKRFSKSIEELDCPNETKIMLQAVKNNDYNTFMQWQLQCQLNNDLEDIENGDFYLD